MPWWVGFALDWFPAVLVAAVVGWWLELPIGASIAVFLIVVGLTRVAQRLVRRGAPPAAGSPAADPEAGKKP